MKIGYRMSDELLERRREMLTQKIRKRKPKVYGWSGITSRGELPGQKSYRIQARFVAMAKSKADLVRFLVRFYGEREGLHPRNLFCLNETGNTLEVELCNQNPECLFVKAEGNVPFFPVESEA